MYIRMGFNVRYIVVELIGLFELLIILRVCLSWFINPEGRTMVFLTRVTEKAVNPVRNVFERIVGRLGIDFSPALTVILLELLKRLILWL